MISLTETIEGNNNHYQFFFKYGRLSAQVKADWVLLSNITDSSPLQGEADGRRHCHGEFVVGKMESGRRVQARSILLASSLVAMPG